MARRMDQKLKKCSYDGMFLVGSCQEETKVGKGRNQQASDRILGGHSLLSWRLAYIFWSKTRATVALKKLVLVPIVWNGPNRHVSATTGSWKKVAWSDVSFYKMWIRNMCWAMLSIGKMWCLDVLQEGGKSVEAVWFFGQCLETLCTDIHNQVNFAHITYLNITGD